LKTEASVARVGLIGPEDAEFLPELEKLWGGFLNGSPGDVLRPALPFSVIAQNKAGRTVALLGVRFDMRGDRGKSYSVVHYADSLRYPENADLKPGASRFVCAEPLYTSMVVRREISVDPRAPMNLANLRKALGIRASIDCVAFDDGQFSGPDSLGAYERLAGERIAEEEFLASLRAGKSPETLLADASENAGLRALARKFHGAFVAGGAAEVADLAAVHRYRIALRRA
jgi:hypothetical protein